MTDINKIASTVALAVAAALAGNTTKEKTPEEVAKEADFLKRVAEAEKARRGKILTAAKIKATVIIDPDMPAGIAGAVLMSIGDRLSYSYNRQRGFLEYLASQKDNAYDQGVDRNTDTHPNVDAGSTGEHAGMLDNRTEVESLEDRMRKIQDELDLIEVYGEAASIRIHKANLEIVETTGRDAPFRTKFDISDRAYQAFLTQDRTRRMAQSEQRAAASRLATDTLRRTTVGGSVDNIISSQAA